MASLPRVITVDPTGDVGRIIRSAIDLMGYTVIYADVPNGTEALEEVQRTGCNLLVTAWDLMDDMGGLELALRVKQQSSDTQVLVLGDLDDPDELDEDTAENSPFAYLSRPVNVHTLLRVVVAGMEGEDVKEAVDAPIVTSEVRVDLGPIPPIDLTNAQGFIDQLLTDLGAMAIVLINREGDVLLERGAVGYLDRERLATALLPSAMTNIEIRELIGGQNTSIHFFDGDDHDVYVLSVGLHYFLCVVFDGEIGSRQLGAVTRYGRQTAGDLVALLGPHAWILETPREARREAAKKRKTQEIRALVEEETLQLARSSFSDEELKEEAPIIEETGPILEAIPDEEFDVDALFAAADNLDNVDELFSEEDLEALAKQQHDSRKIDFNSAIELGLLDE